MSLPTLNGPTFITGEPKREYNFLFRLSAPNPFLRQGSSNFLPWTRVLFSDLFLAYISGLAEQVNLPSEKFNVMPVQYSLVMAPFPKGVEISNISVQYLEDELESVARFHFIWQRGILGNSGGLVFEELGKVCCQAIYAPSKKVSTGVLRDKIPLGNAPVSLRDAVPLGAEIPLGGETFPYVFPIQIDRTAPNKAGNNIAKTTITYARVPRLSLSKGFKFNHWSPREKGFQSNDAVNTTS